MRIRSLVGGLALTAATALALPPAAQAGDRYYRGGKGYYGKGGHYRAYNRGHGGYGGGYGYGSYYRGRPYYAPRYYAPYYAAPYYYPPPPPAYYGYGGYGAYRGPHFSIHVAF